MSSTFSERVPAGVFGRRRERVSNERKGLNIFMISTAGAMVVMLLDVFKVIPGGGNIFSMIAMPIVIIGALVSFYFSLKSGSPPRMVLVCATGRASEVEELKRRGIMIEGVWHLAAAGGADVHSTSQILDSDLDVTHTVLIMLDEGEALAPEFVEVLKRHAEYGARFEIVAPKEVDLPQGILTSARWHDDVGSAFSELA